MAHQVNPLDSFVALVQPLIGLPVSLPWKGYGSTIFLEVGQLQPLESKRQRHQNGQACISIDGDWRVENGSAILYGSSCSRPDINNGIAALREARIETLSLFGEVPELVIRFSNGHCLRSMSMATGGPEWTIRLDQDRWLSIKDGELIVGDGTAGFSEQESESFEPESMAASRWGVPRADPVGGQCRDCAHVVLIDGDAYLLDYGVCVESASPFDGRAVNMTSGCAAFAPAGGHRVGGA